MLRKGKRCVAGHSVRMNKSRYRTEMRASAIEKRRKKRKLHRISPFFPLSPSCFLFPALVPLDSGASRL